jgi:phosphate transport system ATP-binding protein
VTTSKAKAKAKTKAKAPGRAAKVPAEDRGTPEDRSPTIALRDVSFDYPDGTRALSNINLDIHPHQITVLFGPSRSGKSTLLRLLNRLSDLELGSHTGEVRFHGRDVFDRDVDVTELRRQISMVFAIPTPLPGTIWENLTYGLRMAGIVDRGELERRVEQSLTQAALLNEVKDRLHHSAFALSGGQKQRLCMARSLALEPDVILLDNPTSGLDPLSTATVEASLAELRKGYTIIMVPHSVQQAGRIADRAAFLLDGELVEVNSAAKIFTSPSDTRTEDYVTGRFG